eukprot:CAMPEP_0194028464 /NCGR_PEP_ID=MMETSP0009_2-20130614/2414_1 /TAXON_ID=210454 /ORGANISM="Grammatophora oceanica, Strain CCMP 410" /LENGTH=453 /DNA_ID=CAMNT_0038667859 /DNA_START=111 /DNA_END=1472 /DNA_ORIENTATION=+
MRRFLMFTSLLLFFFPHHVIGMKRLRPLKPVPTADAKVGNLKKVTDTATITNDETSLAPLRATLFLMVWGSSFVAFRPAPALIERLGTADATKLLSAISATAALIEITGSPLIGSIMDSTGRKPVLVCAALPLLGANILASFAPSAISLGLSKLSGMISVALIVLTSQTILSDTRTGASLSAAFGMNAFLTSLGFLLGALSASQLSLSLRHAYAVSSFTIAGAIVAASFMKETLLRSTTKREGDLSASSSREKQQQSVLSRLLSATRILRRKNLRIFVTLLMISTLPQHMGDVFQIYSKSEWNIDAKEYASFISMFGVVGITGNLVGSALVKRIGIPRLTMLAFLSSIATPLGATLFQFKGTMIGAVVGFLGSAQGLGVNAAFISEGQRSGIPQGQLAGERSSMLALLKIFGPIMYSTLYVQGRDRLGITSLPFIFNICLGSFGFLLSLLYLR